TLLILVPIIWVVMVIVVTRYIKPVATLLYEEGEKTNLMAAEALEAALKFPVIVSSLSIIGWLLMATTQTIVMFQFISFPASEVAKIFLGALSAGTLIALFMNYFFKLALRPELERIIVEYPDSANINRGRGFRMGIRNTLLSSFALMIIIFLLLSSVMDHSRARLALMEEIAQTKLAELRERAEGIGVLIKEKQGIGLLKSYLNEINTGYSGYAFILNEEDKKVIGELKEELEQRVYNAIIGKKIGDDRDSGRSLISFLPGIRDYFLAIDSKTIRIVVHTPLESKGWHLVGVYPWEDYKAKLSGMINGSIVLIIGTIIISIVIAFLVGNDVSVLLRKIAASLEGISGGDLSSEVTVVSESEVGHLAMSLRRMIGNLRGMIGKITETELSLDTVAARVGDSSERVSRGAASQSASVEDTSSFMEQMEASIKSVSESAEVLSTSADESSSSIFEMGATIEEVAESVESLSKSVEETVSAISEMAIANRQVAENAEALSSITEETASSMMEMDASIKEVEFSAHETSKLSERVGENAQRGVQAVNSTIKGIDRIKTAVQEAARVINSLGLRADEIGKILGVIEDVAEETNLLALNAAILAAQAGEHGRGFAVVADEIRDLAERTAASTKEIAVLIQAVQEESSKAVGAMAAGAQSVEEGVQLSRRAGDALERILESIKRSNEMVGGIAKAAVSQSGASRQVTEAVEKISEMVQEIARATQEQARGSEQVMRVSEQMKGVTFQVKRTTQEQSRGSKLITKSMESILEMVKQINQATREQARGGEQVIKAIDNIKGVAQGNITGSTEMFNAVEILKEQINQLKDGVGIFRL
ncbi:MAG: HAMP domain-containing protein, partial [Deltaproteobacteria bacterium]